METKGSISSNLDVYQRQVVEAIEGPVLVISGPGAGKTTTVVNRIAYLIDNGIQPETICALTFTNRAGKEMTQRAYTLIGDRVKGVFIGTIHRLGLKILGDSGYRSFLLIDRDRQLSIINSLLKKDGDKKAEKIMEEISRIKNYVDGIKEEIQDIYDTYEAYLLKERLIDFDDLIKKSVEIIEAEGSSNPYRGKFHHIIVDEYQDINHGQYRLIRLLLNDGGNICAVGDSDQAIYAFRGADMEIFLNFEKDFRGTKRLALSFNYRSTGNIVCSSSKVIEKNKRRIEKRLEWKREMGDKIRVVSVPDEKHEGIFIVQEIETLIGGTSHYSLYRNTPKYTNCPNYAFSDFAVLFRTNSLVSAVEEAFISSGLPYQVIGRRNIQKREKIKEIVRLLESEHGLKGDALRQIIDLIIPMGKYNLHDFGTREKLLSFINELSLLSPADDYNRETDAISLMTIHMAKGLEFKVLFLAGVEDGILPYTLNGRDGDEEEERRLFYVGMTRAADRLYLIHSKKRMVYGKFRQMSESRFVSEIPDTFIERVSFFDKGVKSRKKGQMSLF